MNIQSINRLNGNDAKLLTDRRTEAASPFSDFLSAATENLNGVNALTKEADQMSVDFALGRIDNVADVMVAQEKASIALQYTVQLRNKLLDAYNEIMRMQV